MWGCSYRHKYRKENKIICVLPFLQQSYHERSYADDYAEILRCDCGVWAR